MNFSHRFNNPNLRSKKGLDFLNGNYETKKRSIWVSLVRLKCIHIKFYYIFPLDKFFTRNEKSDRGGEAILSKNLPYKNLSFKHDSN